MKEKMRVIAVVCEYNPFHEGHKYMLDRARALYAGEDTAILCIMSGDFVQRGEPAVYDKYSRAKMALEGGADLVLELPAPYSCSVAEHFASAAISIIHRLSVVDALAFGSEQKDAETLLKIGKRLSSPEFLRAREEYRRDHRSLSFPRLQDAAYAALYGEPLSLSSNEILGVQYLLALEREGSTIVPHALPMLEGVCASAIREKIREEGKVCDPAFLENGQRAVLSHLSLSRDGGRFAKHAPYCESLAELFSRVQNANDTDARLKRELLFTLFDLPEGYEKRPPDFTVLLGANSKGRALLSDIEKKSSVPLVSKQSAGEKAVGAPFEEYLRLQRLYAIFTREEHHSGYLFEKHPVIL